MCYVCVLWVCVYTEHTCATLAGPAAGDVQLEAVKTVSLCQTAVLQLAARGSHGDVAGLCNTHTHTHTKHEPESREREKESKNQREKERENVR